MALCFTYISVIWQGIREFPVIDNTTKIRLPLFHNIPTPYKQYIDTKNV
ncbi:hypothetical protein VCRA2119O240_480010 [Vibrio crassostreae]|nr:hypothetical protein VCRA2118O236_470007 [Vibrio crassostreae]CAK2121419.1 hypothetical protein VCRA2113O198_440011 [Vibrio crassostreae]CAK2122488.1 hypothetical protein VCRA2110O181_430007 [Vibrio crassostreae]CAK2122494.1 hypothetical protein VCRA2110O177_450004 [Vibrio crassostreae]CAK2123846.1 hypothetical protein VCRA2110O180_460007 [Vibrio crassostreae]